MKKLRTTTSDLTQINIDKLAELFPTLVTETIDADGQLKVAIDFDLLRQELSGHVVEGLQERYQLDWPGKRAAALSANAPIAKTLRPVRKESVDFDTTKNLYIEGDNLDALKLLQESYLGKVKLIYIDPPYNTGGDLLYDDEFSTSTGEYLLRSGQSTGGVRLVANTEANGRFHSDWLSMMYSRLRLARDLLMEEGFIFISIDDNEAHNLRRLCDEVFGGENFVTTLAWQKTLTRRNDATFVSAAHEYVVCYARSRDAAHFNKVATDSKQRTTYSNRDNDPRGDWLAVPFHAPNIRPNLTYPITTPSGRILLPPSGRCWSTTREQFERLVADDRIYFGKTGDGMAQRKKFWSEREAGMVPWTWWSHDDAGENRGATKEIKDLFDGEMVFTAPKPTKLIRKILELVPANDGDIVLDFFGGSGTTADAVFQWNASNKVQWNFIVVQIDEAIDSKSVAGTAGYSDIASLGRERVRRSAAAACSHSGMEEDLYDFGFRAFKVEDNGFTDRLQTPENWTQASLSGLEATVRNGRSAEDLAFEVLLSWGLPATMEMATKQIEGAKVLVIGGDALVACFEDSVDTNVIEAMARLEPLRAVFLDSGFDSDSSRINAEQIFKEISPATDVKVL